MNRDAIKLMRWPCSENGDAESGFVTMDTTDTSWRETFTGPGVHARVACDDGACLIDLSVDQRNSEVGRAVVLELLLQPSDKDGLPFGSVVELLRQVVPLRPTPDGTRAVGHLWLPPSLTPRILKKCYVRVTPAKGP
jgi:hypothetical protein